MTAPDLKRARAESKARDRQLGRAIFVLKVERAWLKAWRSLLRLFFFPGRLMDLPPGHPYRFFAAQIILYVGMFAIVATVVFRR